MAEVESTEVQSQLSRLMMRCHGSLHGSRRPSFGMSSVRERYSRLSENTTKWARKYVSCLEVGRDTLIQQEAALSIAALAGIGLAHRNALLSTGTVAALAACLQAAGREHALVAALCRAMTELCRIDAKARADLRARRVSALLCAYLDATSPFLLLPATASALQAVQAATAAGQPPPSPTSRSGLLLALQDSGMGSPGAYNSSGPNSGAQAELLLGVGSLQGSGSVTPTGGVSTGSGAGYAQSAIDVVPEHVNGCVCAVAALVALSRDDAGRADVVAAGLVPRCLRLLADTSSGRCPEVAAAAALLLAELLVLECGQQEVLAEGAGGGGEEGAGVAVVVGALDHSADGACEAALMRCLLALACGEDARKEAISRCGGLPAIVRLLGCGPWKPTTSHAAQALAYLSRSQASKQALLGLGALPALLRCLGYGASSPVATWAAHALCNLCTSAQCAQEVLALQGDRGGRPAGQAAGLEAMLELLRAPERGPASALVLRAIANMAAHKHLRARLASSGAAAALLPFLEQPPPAAGAAAGSGAPLGLPWHEEFKEALAALAGLAEQEQVQGALAAGQAVTTAVAVVGTAPGPEAAAAAAAASGGAGAGLDEPEGGGAPVLVTALELLARLCGSAVGVQAVLAVQGHLALMQRLMATMAAMVQLQAQASPAAAAGSALLAAHQRVMEACAVCLARLALEAPCSGALRAARLPELLLRLLLAAGPTSRPGLWAMQGLCSLASNEACASMLVRELGITPLVVAALRELSPMMVAAQQKAAQQKVAQQDQGQGQGQGAAVDPVAAEAAMAAAVEAGHLALLMLQNLAGQRVLAPALVAAGAVQALCVRLEESVACEDVEGAVHCCVALCLLGSSDLATQGIMVAASAHGHLVDLLGPRWAAAPALVPAMVCSAIAVACRTPASAQAVRTAGGIQAMQRVLLGPNGMACVRAAMAAFNDWLAVDPPSKVEMRNLTMVSSLGTALMLLPDNDPRADLVRDLLVALGEDPHTVVRLTSAVPQAATGPGSRRPSHMRPSHSGASLPAVSSRQFIRHPSGLSDLSSELAPGSALQSARNTTSSNGYLPSLPALRPAANGDARTSPTSPAHASAPGAQASPAAAGRASPQPASGPDGRQGQASHDDDWRVSYRALRRTTLMQLAARLDTPADPTEFEEDVEAYLSLVEQHDDDGWSRQRASDLPRGPIGAAIAYRRPPRQSSSTASPSPLTASPPPETQRSSAATSVRTSVTAGGGAPPSGAGVRTASPGAQPQPLEELETHVRRSLELLAGGDEAPDRRGPSRPAAAPAAAAAAAPVRAAAPAAPPPRPSQPPKPAAAAAAVAVQVSAPPRAAAPPPPAAVARPPAASRGVSAAVQVEAPLPKAASGAHSPAPEAAKVGVATARVHVQVEAPPRPKAAAASSNAAEASKPAAGLQAALPQQAPTASVGGSSQQAAPSPAAAATRAETTAPASSSASLVPAAAAPPRQQQGVPPLQRQQQQQQATQQAGAQQAPVQPAGSAAVAATAPSQQQQAAAPPPRQQPSPASVLQQQQQQAAAPQTAQGRQQQQQQQQLQQLHRLEEQIRQLQQHNAAAAAATGAASAQPSAGTQAADASPRRADPPAPAPTPQQQQQQAPATPAQPAAQAASASQPLLPQKPTQQAVTAATPAVTAPPAAATLRPSPAAQPPPLPLPPQRQPQQQQDAQPLQRAQQQDTPSSLPSPRAQPLEAPLPPPSMPRAQQRQEEESSSPLQPTQQHGAPPSPPPRQLLGAAPTFTPQQPSTPAAPPQPQAPPSAPQQQRKAAEAEGQQAKPIGLRPTGQAGPQEQQQQPTGAADGQGWRASALPPEQRPAQPVAAATASRQRQPLPPAPSSDTRQPPQPLLEVSASGAGAPEAPRPQQPERPLQPPPAQQPPVMPPAGLAPPQGTQQQAAPPLQSAASSPASSPAPPPSPPSPQALQQATCTRSQQQQQQAEPAKQQPQQQRGNPMAGLLGAVNPLRLFGGGRKQQPQRVDVTPPTAGQHGAAEAPVNGAHAHAEAGAPNGHASSRSSLQIDDGGELVFWEPGAGAGAAGGAAR